MSTSGRRIWAVDPSPLSCAFGIARGIHSRRCRGGNAYYDHVVVALGCRHVWRNGTRYAPMPQKATTFLDSVRVDFHSTGNAMAPRTNTAKSEYRYRLIVNRKSHAHVDDPLTEADLGAPLWTGANRLDGGSARASLTVAPVLTWTWRTRPHS